MSAPQLTRNDLRGMSPRQIEDARQAGQLANLLAARPAPAPADVPRIRQFTRAEVAALTPAQVEDARRAGHLAELLGGTPPVDLDGI